MATRRILAVLLVMLFLTTLIAALAPVERSGTTSSSTSSTTTTTTNTAPETESGSLLSEEVAASVTAPPRVQAEAGDQLQLTITSKQPGTIEIPALGEAEDVDPRSPARFDLLLESADTYAVRFLGSERIVAFIEVSASRADSAPERD